MWVVLTFLIAVLIIYILSRVFRAGYWDANEVDVVERPEYFGEPTEIFYKYCLGQYSQYSAYLKNVRALLPRDAKIVAFYYDDPKLVADKYCQSVVGCVYSVNGTPIIDPHFSSQLVRWGFERMALPAVSRTVQTQQPFTDFFSQCRLNRRTHPALKSFIKENRLDVAVNVEVYEGDRVTVLCPLDHQKEFYVPEYGTMQELHQRELAELESDSELDSDSYPEDDDDISDSGDDEPIASQA